MAPPAVESWDNDDDLQGELFAVGNSTLHQTKNNAGQRMGNLSSRVSVRSESNMADEDWQMLISPNDTASKTQAISSAAQIGFPLPANVPSTALLGGSIKRLGKKKSKKDVSDDWGDDFVMADVGLSTLKIRQVNLESEPKALEQEEFDSEWAEGSLGFRHAGKSRDTRGRSSSVSAMSPSMGSCMTAESEDDDLGGLVLPSGPLDFSTMLKKRKATDYDPPAAPVQPQARDQRPKQNDQDDDIMTGLEFGGDLLDTKKRKINRNVKIKQLKPTTPVARTGTTVTFTDKSSKIPRPAQLPPTPRSHKLDPVPESNNAVQVSRMQRFNRPSQTTGAPLLRSKRSAPLLGAKPPSGSRPPVPFLPAGITPAQSHHITAKSSSTHLRNLSDQHERPQSPPHFVSKNFSRPSSAQPQANENTPSRSGFRRDGPSASLLRQVASQRTLPKRKTFGDGTELDRFDDLPTSQAKESRYVKEPANRLPAHPGGKTLRSVQSKRNLSLHQQAHSISVTPPVPPSVSSATSTLPSTPLAAAPPTPKYPFGTPSFARDTAASRQRGGQPTVRGLPRPVEQSVNKWRNHIANSPQGSPNASRKRRTDGKQPFLIKNMGNQTTKRKYILSNGFEMLTCGR
jgi:hypothetical protein